jgi:WD40 repeat protein
MQIRRIHTCTGHRASVYALAPGRDHLHFLSAGGDGWIVEWNIGKPETGMLVANTESNIFSLCRLPQRQLAVGNMNGGLHWIHLDEPEKARLIQSHRKGIYDMKYIGDKLFSAGGDGLLTVWNTEKQLPEASIQLSAVSLRCIAHAPERNELAIGCSDNRIIFLNLSSLAITGEIRDAHSNSVFSLAYSPDEKTLLSGGRDAFLRIHSLSDNGNWERDARNPEMAAHLFTINHIVFSPDASMFATASRDKTIKLWDFSSGRLLKVLDTVRYGGHVNSVNRLLWVDNVLLSASDDRTVSIWEIGNQTLARTT